MLWTLCSGRSRAGRTTGPGPLRQAVNRGSLLRREMPYRPTPETRRRKEATRERIVSAALEQVAEGGYASAGIQNVARRAKVATGTVYRHFPSKSALFSEVFRRASE